MFKQKWKSEGQHEQCSNPVCNSKATWRGENTYLEETNHAQYTLMETKTTK